MPGVRVAWYTGTLFAGYLLMLTAGIWIWRLLRHDLLDDVFNDENEFGEPADAVPLSGTKFSRLGEYRGFS